MTDPPNTRRAHGPQRRAEGQALALRPSPGTQIDYLPDWLAAARADALFQDLSRTLDWRCDSVQLFGRRHPIPRRHAWLGEPGVSYGWSGLRHPPCPWPPALAEVADAASDEAGCRFNGVLANLYRDGRDCMGWHSDDERSLGEAPVVAALSLGATRPLAFKPRRIEGERFEIALAHGSLLLMRGHCQRDWQHSLPRRLRVQAPRISLTFRSVQSTPRAR